MRVRCPAKVNVFLEVLGKRADGYHEIATVMAPVSLYDTLTVREAKRDALSVTPRGSAPSDGTNTVMKALGALRRKARFPAVAVALEKRIPAGAGLGGGSSDAAGAVRAANRLFELGLSVADEADVLAEVGSDTAFFAWGGWAMCTGRGEKVQPLTGREVPLVIVVPPYENPTREVYARYRHEGPRRRTVRWFNRLEKAAFEFRPELAKLKAAMRALPFEHVLLSGSGSAMLGVCGSAAAQKRLAVRCRQARWGRVFAVRTIADSGSRTDTRATRRSP